MDKVEGIIFNIQRFSVNDGPGIRTTVFLKGCPLRCLWCHNPESNAAQPQLMFSENKCIGCRKCEAVCPNKCHSFSGALHRHSIERSRCDACGQCASACFGALEISGKYMTPDAVMTEVLKDRAFYDNSGGGMTVSGGEPFFQSAFLIGLLQRARQHGIGTCIETCGYTKAENLIAAAEYTDIFLFDWKESDSEKHLENTGVDNLLIEANLRMLHTMGKPIVLRCPLIPGYNDREDHFEKIGRLANELTSIIRIDVEPYHPLGLEKRAQLGMQNGFTEKEFVNGEKAHEWIRRIQSFTACPVMHA